MTNDRVRARREFLRLEPVVRVRQIAETLSAITDLIVQNQETTEIFERIDACAWMIEWAVPHEEPAVQAQLVELQARLGGLRKELSGLCKLHELLEP